MARLFQWKNISYRLWPLTGFRNYRGSIDPQGEYPYGNSDKLERFEDTKFV